MKAATARQSAAKPQSAFSRILVPTDFSEPSQAAIQVAGVMARQLGSTVYLAHAVAPMPASPEALLGYAEPLLDAAERDLEALSFSSGLKNVAVKRVVRNGYPVPELLEFIESERVGLVISGTHGRGGVKRLLLGSVAEELCRSAPCPVMTVGPHFLHGNLLTGGINHILYPMDLSDESRAALKSVHELAEEFGALVTFVHVLPIEAGSNPDARTLATPLKDEMRKAAAAAGIRDCEFEVEFGDPHDVILRLAKERSISLIALGVRSSFGLASHFPGNVAYKVMVGATCPVMMVRAAR
jgi:nucleotide-binding universal stress UspA family protein